MKNRPVLTQFAHLLLILSLVLGCASIAGASGWIPITSARQSILPADKENALPDIQSFIVSVTNGQSGLPTGVYVPGVLALKIIQQPEDNAAFISKLPDTLTQFRMASSYLTVGLLVHNFLAGSQFFNLQLNQQIILVLGDGSQYYYKIDDIQSYQALSPTNPYSNFISPDGQKNLSSEEVFRQVYAKGNQLVFQTCIQKGNEDSWGRLFVIADKVDILQTESINTADYVSAAHFRRAVVGTD
jgi:hypothetical protein